MLTERKETILLQALDALDENGVKFKIEDLCENLQISKRTFYKIFSSKDELLNEIFTYIYEHTSKQYRVIIHTQQSEVEKIKSLLGIYPDLYRVTNAELSRNFSLNSSVIVKCYALGNVIKGDILDRMRCLQEENQIKSIHLEHFVTIFEAVFEKTVSMKNRKTVAEDCIAFLFHGILYQNP